MVQISLLQVAYLLVTIHSIILLFLLPGLSGTSPTNDAWLAVIIGTLLGLIPTWLACKVAALRPDKDLAQICEACLGRWLGKAVAVLYLCFFAIDAAVVLRQFGDFLTTAPMRETPPEFFLGMLGLAAAFAIWLGIEVLARANEIVLPPLILFVLFVLLLGLKDMDANRLKPMLAEGLGPVLRGSTVVGALASEAMIVTMLAPHLKETKLLFRYAGGAVLTSGLWLVLSVFGVLTFFGGPHAAIQIFPVYALMRDVSVADFLERLDPLFLIAVTSASFIKLALLLYVSARLMQRILGLRDYRPLALPLGFLGAMAALLLFESVVDLRTFNSPNVLPLLAFPFGVLLPLVLLAVGRMRGLGGNHR